MIVHVAVSLGQTLDYVGWNIDLPRLRSLNKYWRKYPPVHVLFSAYVGYKEPAEPVIVASSTGEAIEADDVLAEFFAMVPQREVQKPVARHVDRTEP